MFLGTLQECYPVDEGVREHTPPDFESMKAEAPRADRRIHQATVKLAFARQALDRGLCLREGGPQLGRGSRTDAGCRLQVCYLLLENANFV